MRKSLLVSLLAAAALGQAQAAPNPSDHPIDLKHGPEIKRLVETAGWVSPGLSKTKVLYMVSWEYCPPCEAFEKEEFPKLHAAGVDTRVIMYAHKGAGPAEEAGVAELWKNRSWATWQKFTAIPTSTWTAEGIPPATEPDRAALVKKSQAFADKMREYMSDNGIGTKETLNLPTLIWMGKDGAVRGCGCENVETRKYVLQELGVPT